VKHSVTSRATDAPTRSSGARGRFWLLSLGVAAALDRMVTVEWSFPYCKDQGDGPAHAVFGVIPYEHFSGYSSLVFTFQPVLYVANLFVTTLLCAGMLLALHRWTRSLGDRGVSRTLGVVGGLLVAATGARHLVMVEIGLWQPVPALDAPDPWYHLRPVGLALGRHERCTPSKVWFDP
jgi:hypothetical protein